MTTVHEKRSFFSIYKPGQGTYVRWGTAGGAGLLVLIGAWWIGHQVLGSFNDLLVQTIGVVVWITVGAALIFWLVNKPNFAEFMIMTESEMRKVTWPSRRAVITSTRVVIFLTLLLAIVLWLVDVGFKTLFEHMGIL